MFHTIRDQYDIITAEQGFQTDFQAMLDWLSYWNMKPCDSEYFGEEINSILVNRWVNYRDSLFNSQGINRLYLEQCARRLCEPDDLDEFEDNLVSTSDGHLMALGRIFYSQPNAVEPDGIAIHWSIEDIKHICPKVTDQQARDVLHFLKTNHNAEIGINWDVIDSAIDEVLPEIAENSDDTERYVDAKYANDIIDGHPELYNSIEIHGVIKLVGSDLPGGEWIELNDEKPNQYCVYLHMVTGGISCVGDFSAHDFALTYARELSNQYGWKIYDFVGSNPVHSGIESGCHTEKTI